jgi:hypothetical protein
VEKSTVKQLRTQIATDITAYNKVNGKYQQLKTDGSKAKAIHKKDVAALESRLKDKAAKLKQDEAAVAAVQATRDIHAYKLKLRLEGDDYKNDKKERELKAKERKRDTLEIARSVSSNTAFSIPQNEQELQAILGSSTKSQPPPQYYQQPPTPQYFQQQPPPHYPPTGYAQYQYQAPAPPPCFQQGMQPPYPAPPTMARASSASSVTPTQEEGATYTTQVTGRIGASPR